MRGLACGKAGDAFSCFGVPELHLAVEGGGEEGCAVWVEVGVGDGLGVPGEGAEQGARVVGVPEGDFGVGSGGEEQVR